MTMVTLTKPVQVPRGDGRFVMVTAGTKVNYSCKKNENGAWVHKFSFYHWGDGRLLEYIEAVQERPTWL